MIFVVNNLEMIIDPKELKNTCETALRIKRSRQFFYSTHREKKQSPDSLSAIELSVLRPSVAMHSNAICSI